MANKKNKRSTRKRRFRGNQHTDTVTKKAKINSPKKTLRAEKVLSAQDVFTSSSPTDEDYFILVQFEILKGLLENIGCCPNSNGKNKLSLVDKLPLRMGFAHKISLCCQKCLWSTDFFTSKQCNKCLWCQCTRKTQV